MLTLEQVTIRQGAFELRADMSLARDQLTAVIGPSGAGKSTLLGVIAGFITPHSGRVLIDQVDQTATEPGQRPVSIVFQDSNLFPHLSVVDNVGLGLRPSLKLTKSEQAQVTDAIDWVGLGGLAGRKPAALSGGQQSRVALARVLLRAAPLVLLDEPFAALGPALKDEMLELVTAIMTEHNRTVVMVTHDASDARRFADRVVMVDSGTAHPPVDTEALFSNPPEALRDYLGT